MFKAIEMGYWK